MPASLALNVAQPSALLALLVVLPVLYAMRIAARRERAAAAAYGGPPELRVGGGAGRRRLRDALLISAIVLSAVALARPRWGESDVPLQRRGIDVAIALDISRSMSASDVAPTRAAGAVAGLSALLEHLPDDRVGLVTFAGSALSRAPLTTDLGAIQQLVAGAQGEAPLVQAGSSLGAAIDAALAMLDIDDPADTQVIVLVSDGEQPIAGAGVPAIDAALEHARERDVRVYTAIAGTEAGGRLTDRAATAPELSRADPNVLQRIADESGGEATTVQAMPGLAVEFRRMSQSLFAQETQTAPIERFQWFVGAALVLLLAHGALGISIGRRPSRRGRAQRGRSGAAPALVLIALVGAGCSGSALYQAVTRGNVAYEAERYDVALAAYQEASELAPEDPAVLYNLGNALHQLRRYEEAAVSTGTGSRLVEDPAQAFLLQYSGGAHAFRRGVLEEARTAYISALRLEPDDADAKANLELVLLILNPPPPPDADGADDQPGEDTAPGGGNDAPPSPDGQPQDGGQDDGSGAGAGAPGPSATATPVPGGTANGGAAEPIEPTALAAAQAELTEALAALGAEPTLEEALRVLALARRANALQELPARGGSAPER